MQSTRTNAAKSPNQHPKKLKKIVPPPPPPKLPEIVDILPEKLERTPKIEDHKKSWKWNERSPIHRRKTIDKSDSYILSVRFEKDCLLKFDIYAILEHEADKLVYSGGSHGTLGETARFSIDEEVFISRRDIYIRFEITPNNNKKVAYKHYLHLEDRVDTDVGICKLASGRIDHFLDYWVDEIDNIGAEIELGDSEN